MKIDQRPPAVEPQGGSATLDGTWTQWTTLTRFCSTRATNWGGGRKKHDTDELEPVLLTISQAEAELLCIQLMCFCGSVVSY